MLKIGINFIYMQNIPIWHGNNFQLLKNIVFFIPIWRGNNFQLLKI
jgi:hypothetical protein